jgi:hypothetical protein
MTWKQDDFSRDSQKIRQIELPMKHAYVKNQIFVENNAFSGVFGQNATAAYRLADDAVGAAEGAVRRAEHAVHVAEAGVGLAEDAAGHANDAVSPAPSRDLFADDPDFLGVCTDRRAEHAVGGGQNADFVAEDAAGFAEATVGGATRVNYFRTL